MDSAPNYRDRRTLLLEVNAEIAGKIKFSAHNTKANKYRSRSKHKISDLFQNSRTVRALCEIREVQKDGIITSFKQAVMNAS